MSAIRRRDGHVYLLRTRSSYLLLVDTTVVSLTTSIKIGQFLLAICYVVGQQRDTQVRQKMAGSKMADINGDKNAGLAAFYWLKLCKKKTLSNGLGSFLDTAVCRGYPVEISQHRICSELADLASNYTLSQTTTSCTCTAILATCRRQ